MQHFIHNSPPCYLHLLARESMLRADFRPGHYRALLWDGGANAWQLDEAMGIHVNVQAS